LQGVIAPEMQGRVFALVFTLAAGMAPLGLILAGPAADLLGVRVWYWAGGIVCALMGASGFLIPAVLNLEEQSGGSAVKGESSQ
jgi:MFS transporter, DHA3 family, macrolide efflux protein